MCDAQSSAQEIGRLFKTLLLDKDTIGQLGCDQSLVNLRRSILPLNDLYRDDIALWLEPGNNGCEIFSNCDVEGDATWKRDDVDRAVGHKLRESCHLHGCDATTTPTTQCSFRQQGWR